MARRDLRTKTGSPTPVLEFKEFQARLLTKAEDLEATPGVVEALVAVTGNTDDGGDVIQPKAFQFKRAPKVVWSHNLRELVGKVLEYEEWLPGDPRLPADLKAAGFGALFFRMQFDLEDPESFKAYRKVVFHEDLGWSIGYEVDPKGFKMLPDGRRSLTKIYVWEGSPTTFGMNQEARTVSVKSLISTTVEDLGLPEEKATALQAALVALLESVQPETEEKAYVPLAGSYEETQSALREAVEEWAVMAIGERGDDLDWYVNVEGTFEDSVVASVRIWKGEGQEGTWRFPYVEGEDGAITLGDAEEVVIQATVAPGASTAEVEVEEEAADDFEDEEKAMAALESAQAVVDAAAEETKAGRVLSEANAAALETAMETIKKVLAAAKKPKAAEDEGGKKKPAEKTVLARSIQTKGAPAEVEAPEGFETLDQKDLLELVALANS